MAREQQVVITDDYTGKKLPADTKPTKLTLNGKSWNLDLSKSSVAELEKAIKPFVDGAQRVKQAPSKASKRHSPAHLKKVREWAKSNGYKVSDRGRIPAHVLEAYEAAK